MLLFHNFTLLTLCKFLIACLINHFKNLFQNLESIKNVEFDRGELLRQKPPKNAPFGSVFNSNHLFPLLFACFLIFDTLYGLSQNGWQYSSQGLPDLAIHRMYPPAFHQLVSLQNISKYHPISKN